jgi:hypothetical protein
MVVALAALALLVTVAKIFASALREIAEVLDPKPTPEPPKLPDAQRDLFLKPVTVTKLGGFERSAPLVPLPDFDRHRGAGWGNYL